MSRSGAPKFSRRPVEGMQQAEVIYFAQRRRTQGTGAGVDRLFAGHWVRVHENNTERVPGLSGTAFATGVNASAALSHDLVHL
jgi:hypothetical protein